MKIALPSGKTVGVWIEHDHPVGGLVVGGNLGVINGRTRAKVKIDGLNHESYGWAICAMGDHFVKRKGVAIALRRALGDAKIGREDRKVIWAKVFNLKPSPSQRLISSLQSLVTPES